MQTGRSTNSSKGMALAVNICRVLVGFNKSAGDTGKDIAMQIAAMNPVAVDAASTTSKFRIIIRARVMR